MNNGFSIGSSHVAIDDVVRMLENVHRISLDETAKTAVSRCRAYLESKLNDSSELYYGINTGFGSQYNKAISANETERLQQNLILSHAAGAGDPIDPEVARAIMLLKVISLCKGFSGVRLQLVEQLVTYLNNDLIPVIYEFGSLGASGDLAPLAHMSLTLIGKGSFYANSLMRSAEDVLKEFGLSPLTLQAKEGLALINGTQFSTAHGVLAWSEGIKLLRLANVTAALSLEGFNCNMTPFDERIQQVRGHAGQAEVASQILELMDGSVLAYGPDKQLQDPYAFRCIPQVHGATYDALSHAGSVLETELNAVTDNPLVFPDSDGIISGGNFHAQPVALLLDYLAIAISELGNISERRTYKLLSGQRGIPDCLVHDAGLKSGLMIAQYTAASIVNRNKILCTPASSDSIPSSNGQEDHVSMAANSATKLREIVRNVRTIVAIEFLSAMQAIDLRHLSDKLSPSLREIHSAYRQDVPFIEEDVIMHDYIKNTERFFTAHGLSE